MAVGAGSLAVAGLLAIVLVVGKGCGSVAVTMKPAAPPRAKLPDGEKGPARAVLWSGQGPTHPLAAREHNIKSILDFQDVAGASLKEFRQWQAGLAPRLPRVVPEQPQRRRPTPVQRRRRPRPRPRSRSASSSPCPTRRRRKSTA